MPGGVLVTVPLPLPALVRVSAGVAIKVAVTVVAAVRVTVQEPSPVHPPPLQLPKRTPMVAVALSVTLVPWSKAALQVSPQLIPTGLLVTVPIPVPALFTCRDTCEGP